MPKRGKLTEAQKQNRKEAALEKGHDPQEADAWHYSLLAGLGIAIDDGLWKWKAKAMIAALRLREPVEGVALVYLCHDQEPDYEILESYWTNPAAYCWHVVVDTPWERLWASPKQISTLEWKRLRTDDVRCRRDAGLRLDALFSPEKFVEERQKDLVRARTGAELDMIGLDLRFVAGILPVKMFQEVAAAGRQRRQEIKGGIPL